MNATLATSLRPELDRSLLLDILDEIDYGIVFVSGHGRVGFANRMADRQCLSREGLHIRDGFIRTADARDQDRLLQALQGALRGRRSLLTLAGAGGGGSLAVVPVAGNDDGKEPMALLLFGRANGCPTLSFDFFARAHGLTQAEATVLRGLCDGLSPHEVAHHGKVAISTVRTQIRSVRSKTATASIRDLIGRISALPPIVPARCVA